MQEKRAVARRLSKKLRLAQRPLFRHADQILVLHHGQVRERGRHEEPIKLGGIYSRLYQLNYGSLRVEFENSRLVHRAGA